VPSFNGFVGLAKIKDSKNVLYSEYLKNRKLIPENTLAIEPVNASLSSWKFTFGAINKISSSAPLLI